MEEETAVLWFPLYHYLFPYFSLPLFLKHSLCRSLSSSSISYFLSLSQSFSPQHPSFFLSIFVPNMFFLINSSIFFSVKTWECRIFKFSVHYYDDGCPSGGSVPSLPFIWENIRVFLSILFYNFHFHGLGHEMELKNILTKLDRHVPK
jgi:hypothetical protein